MHFIYLYTLLGKEPPFEKTSKMFEVMVMVSILIFKKSSCYVFCRDDTKIKLQGTLFYPLFQCQPIVMVIFW